MTGLLRSNLIVAAGTALSRLTGFARIAVFAIVIGQSALADAFNSANQSPNAIYELLLGGVLSASLVPLFTRHAERNDDDATSAVATVAVIALTAITAVSVAAAPMVFRLFSLDVATGVNADDYRNAGTALARIFLIQIFFYGLTAIASALLQARRRYFASAWAPVLSNLVIIVSLLFVPSAVRGREPELMDLLTNDRLRMILALGTTIGIATTAFAMLPALRPAGVKLRFKPDFRHPAVGELVRLSGWTLGYVAANQVSIVVIQNLADPGSGQLTAYAFAYIFFVLPHGLLAMSIVTTFTPEMTRSVQRNDRDGFIAQCSSGVRIVALLTFPAAAAMFVLRRPIVGVALQHGNFDAADAALTSRALGGFALGLVGFSVYLFVLRGFYAHGDGRTPFIINIVENVFNIVLAFVLYPSFGVLGLAASFAIAYTASSAIALTVMASKVPGFSAGSVLRGMWKMALAATVMAELMWLIGEGVGSNSGVGALFQLTIAGSFGIGTYVGVLVVLQVPEVREIRTRLGGRFT